MKDLSVELLGEILKNPIIPASGTFGFGYEFADYYDINILGSIALKGTTVEARYGNPLPRIAECPAGMLNSIGLQNPGAPAVLNEELPKLKKVYRGKVIVNIGGHSFDDYAQAASVFNDAENVLAVELNISCPNVKGGGLHFGTDALTAERLVSAVKKSVYKPVIVKLTPNVTSVAEIAKAVESGGADAVSLINTLLGMRINLDTMKPVLAAGAGGYSGPGIFPVAVRMIREVKAAVKIPVIGMGGVASAEDALELIAAGASAVMVGSANLVDPFACKKIIEALPSAMERYKIEKISDLVGAAL
ncbi:MAG TPA: dihydroorotate dehydrogenase [Eubacteriales bacterium]|nr:dihydroorotate dehydrogenase [Clostridia bacterium]HRR89709.1 dihydroorotate dehydrogenase [Eubacteriales bacterium]HRU84167.1 dihydroorotate dehydrogenase [Eubacteriales bacterium]